MKNILFKSDPSGKYSKKDYLINLYIIIKKK